MKRITLKLTVKELELLTTLAADQLFRMEFIDPRMAGYRSNPQEMNLGKSLVGRLRLIVDPNSAKRTPPPRINGATV
jgi:hypothetical protein